MEPDHLNQVIKLENADYVGRHFENCIIIFPPDPQMSFTDCTFTTCDMVKYDGRPWRLNEAEISNTTVRDPEFIADHLPLSVAALLGPQARALGALYYRKDLD